MKKRFTLSLIALIASAFLFVIISFAWILEIKRNSINNLPNSLSGVAYNIGGDFIDMSVIYPELNVVDSDISITNYSPVDLYLRVKIEYTKIDVSYDSLNYTYSFSTPIQKDYENIPENEHLAVSMNVNFFYENDGYWYYDGFLDYDIQHILFTSIKYDGLKVSNEYANNDIVINIIIEVTTDLDGIWSPLTTMIYTGTM